MLARSGAPQAMQRSLLLVGLALALVPAAGWAAPFKFTPASFQQWLNANPDRWQEGRRVTFSNLSGCSLSNSYPEQFTCSRGFAKITDPMGSRVCRLMWVSWRGIQRQAEKKPGELYGRTSQWLADQMMGGPGLSGPPGASYRQGECRWQ